jgi:hypothetical protein
VAPFAPRFSLSTELGLTHPSAIAWLEDLREEKLWIADTGNNQVVLIKLPTDNPEAIWQRMKQSLVNGDIPGALSCFASSEVEKYQQAYLALGVNELAKTFSQLPVISPVSVERGEAEYYFQQPVNGIMITFPIHFVREQGKWKILEY